MKKIIFTCPRNETEKLRLVVWEAGAWINGNYSHCSMVSEIEWYFKPNDQANPSIGSIWNIEKVLEHKVEIICEDEQVLNVVEIIKNTHSYETPHIEIYDVKLV
jgi:hypothetical protein